MVLFHQLSPLKQNERRFSPFSRAVGRRTFQEVFLNAFNETRVRTFLIKNIAGRTRSKKRRRLKTAEWKREIINETYACDVVITEKSVFYDPYPNMMD